MPDALDPLRLPLTLDQSARRLGHYAWGAERLFEVTGTLAAEVAAADGPHRTVVALAVFSRRFGAQAVAWRGLIPRTHDHDADALVAPPPAGPAVVDALGAIADPLARVAVLREDVLPAVEAALIAHLGRLTPVADGPVLALLSPGISVVSDCRGSLAGPAATDADRAAVRAALA